MKSILETCQPRKDLISGSFNPEVFTASLRQVIGHYRGDIKVKEFYSRESDTEGVPISVDLDSEGYSLVTPEGAVQRGWNANTKVPFETVRAWVRTSIDQLDEPTSVSDLAEQILTKIESHILEALAESPHETMRQVEIATAGGYSKHATRQALLRLRDMGLVRRPRGERGGEALTTEGRAFLAGSRARE